MEGEGADREAYGRPEGRPQGEDGPPACDTGGPLRAAAPAAAPEQAEWNDPLRLQTTCAYKCNDPKHQLPDQAPGRNPGRKPQKYTAAQYQL